MLRYTMGTLVGAVIFYFLWKDNPGWQNILLFSSSTASPDKLQLTLLVAYGLVYCYIASAPILVFHATRFLLDYRVKKDALLGWSCRYLLIPILVLPITWFIWHRLLWNVVGFVFVFILDLQYFLGARALLNRKRLYDFYDRLAKRRSEVNGGDILDSYRHLREHGNSFFIVLLEILLGLVLYGAGLYQADRHIPSEKVFFLYLMIFLLWIGPSVGVWFIATSFEREFRDAQL